MTPEEYKEAGDLFDRLRELSESEREALLAQACVGKPELRCQVERLLEADKQVAAGSFLAKGALEDAALLLDEKDAGLPHAGTLIRNYRLGSQIGAGAMGFVFAGEDLRLHRRVAIKILPMPPGGENSERVERFLRESRTASVLNHPNIVSIYDADFADGYYYIAMELVQGRTLRQLTDGGKGLPLDRVLKYGVQIADGLSKAHRAGVIHRDLKLSNIMVDDDDRIKILDFGIAKMVDPTMPSGGGEGPQTATGMIVGTAGYMSPEQAEAKPVDARSDIFSFGAVLYEMITGQAAFSGSTPISVITAVLRDEPKLAGEVVSGLPPELVRIVGRCLRKDPQQRFQSAEEIKAALEALREDVATRRRPRARSVWVYVGAAVVAGAIAAALIFAAIRRPAPEAEAPTPARVVPLTAFAGSEREPALSPDGQHVAMSWEGEAGTGNFDIYVKPASGGSPLRLTSDAAADGFPAWSPDGREIAFVRQNESRAGVYVMPALGGRERWLTDSAGGKIAWSPDGRWLVVSDYDHASGEGLSRPARPGTGAPKEGPVCAFVVSVATGERRKLTVSPSDAAFDTDFAFSPDGGSLAFTRWGRAGADVHVQKLTSGAAGPVASGAPIQVTNDNSFIRGLAWTPDGSQLVFSANRSAAWVLWQTAADGRGRVKPLPLAGVTGDAFHPSISRQGRLVYEQALQDVNIWRMDLTRSGARPERLIASTRFDGNPQVSPDGKSLVFTSDRSGVFQIWLAGFDGSNPSQLTSFSSPMTASPRWSPDGKQAAFDSLSGTNREVYVTRVDGGGAPRRITEDPAEDSRPCWSGDGRWVYFMSTRSGSRQLWRAPADGSNSPAVRVTQQGGYECQESLDGKILYYTKDAKELWGMPVGGGVEQLVIPEARLGAWALSGKGIYYVDFNEADPRSPRTVKLYEPGSGRTRQVAVLGEGVKPGHINRPRQPGSAGRMIAVSPDDRWLIWNQTDLAGSDLMLADDFHW